MESTFFVADYSLSLTAKYASFGWIDNDFIEGTMYMVLKLNRTQKAVDPGKNGITKFFDRLYSLLFFFCALAVYAFLNLTCCIYNTMVSMTHTGIFWNDINCVATGMIIVQLDVDDFNAGSLYLSCLGLQLDCSSNSVNKARRIVAVCCNVELELLDSVIFASDVSLGVSTDFARCLRGVYSFITTPLAESAPAMSRRFLCYAIITSISLSHSRVRILTNITSSNTIPMQSRMSLCCIGKQVGAAYSNGSMDIGSGGGSGLYLLLVHLLDTLIGPTLSAAPLFPMMYTKGEIKTEKGGGGHALGGLGTVHAFMDGLQCLFVVLRAQELINGIKRRRSRRSRRRWQNKFSTQDNTCSASILCPPPGNAAVDGDDYEVNLSKGIASNSTNKERLLSTGVAVASSYYGVVEMQIMGAVASAVHCNDRANSCLTSSRIKNRPWVGVEFHAIAVDIILQ